MEKTFVLIKPEAVQRKIIGEILSRFERANINIVEMRMMRATENILQEHYPDREEWYRSAGSKTVSNYEKFGLDLTKDFTETDAVSIGKIVKRWLVEYLTSSDVVAIVMEGNNVVEAVRKLVGPTIPLFAPPGTIRGDYLCDSADIANREKRPIYNLIHASETPEEAEREIAVWLHART